MVHKLTYPDVSMLLSVLLEETFQISGTARPILSEGLTRSGGGGGGTTALREIFCLFSD